jgi:hypothetical protein
VGYLLKSFCFTIHPRDQDQGLIAGRYFSLADPVRPTEYRQLANDLPVKALFRFFFEFDIHPSIRFISITFFEKLA